MPPLLANQGAASSAPSASTASTIHVAGVAYGNAGHAAVLPESSLVGWLLGRLAAASVMSPSTIDVALVRPSHRPPVPTAFSPEWTAALRAKLSQAVSFNRLTDQACRPLASNAFDKQRFLCQWNSYADGGAAPVASAGKKAASATDSGSAPQPLGKAPGPAVRRR